MQMTEFVTVVQRRKLTIDSELFPVISPLFAIETQIGSYVGASSCFLAAAASFKQGTVHCVDTWDNRAMDSEPPRDTFAEFLHNVERFQRYIVPHRGEASAVASEIPSRLDALFIDGDHSYEVVKSELSTYVPKIKAGGFLLLHDSQQEPMQRAMDEYLLTHHLISVGTTHSLCTLRVPHESAEEIRT